MGGPCAGDHGAVAISRHLKVLLPSSSSNNLRISGELARHLDGGGTGSTAAHVVSPLGKIWRVEVGRDADGGAFLGRGWPEFAAAHGFEAGWFLVLRHEAAAASVLTVKAFDSTCCLREFSRPLAVAPNYGVGGDGGGVSRRPQFISVLRPPSMEKMGIPPKFVKKYIAEAETGMSTAVLLSPLCKFCRVAVDKDPSGSGLFFSGGWSRFLASHGIAEYDVLLLRYEGNLVFTVKVFGPDGCQKVFKDQDTSHRKKFEQSGETAFYGCQKGFKDQDRSSEELEHSDHKAFPDIQTEGEDRPSSSRKCKSTAKKRDGQENSKRPKRCVTSSKKALLSSKSSVYEIGPPSWMKSEISAYILANRLMVTGTFCKAIGLRMTSEITLKTTADEGHGLRSWKVRVLVYPNRSRGHITRGWRRFCVDNRIKEGDICTFNVVNITLWHVDITRCR
ncbi:unnamed protein product [Urochloa decumbens]|uniref:TF-B3 domain-containing protein n=1 Tax=Urochloa decumbens TaxID=240449 RepID=A0ABC9D771_9POAL